MATDRQLIPFADQIETRDGTLSKDARNINAYVEQTTAGLMAVKRPGLNSTSYITGIGTAQGLVVCAGTLYSITNNTLWKTTTGATSAITSPGPSNIPYESIDAYTPTTSLLKSLSGLWVFNGTATTKVTDPDYPATTLPGLCELDGTYYVMNAANGYICGSAVKDATTWDALNFIGPSAQLGTGVAVHRHLNYILGFYTEGLQAYYDAENATGSPLSPASNASWRTGCASAASIVELNDRCFFMSQTAEGGRAITCITGLQPNIISTSFVEKMLAGADLTGLRAVGVRVAGHPFYLLSLPALAITLAYDALMKRWDLWTSSVMGAQASFIGAVYKQFAGQDLFQISDTGIIVAMDQDFYSDNGTTITVKLRTRKQTWGTLQLKFFGELLLHDIEEAPTITESHSDEDYQTWSTPRSISLV